MGQHRQRVCANFIGDVAVGRDAIRADHDQVDFAAVHEVASHVVGDERHGHAELLELPGGQPRTLQERSGFVNVDVDTAAGFVGGAHHAQGGAVVDGGERTRVAVRQHIGASGHQVETEGANLPIHDHVFLGHVVGQDQHGRLRRRHSARLGLGFTAGEHAVDGPVQVHCRWSRSAQQRGAALELFDEGRCVERRVCLGTKDQPIGGGNANSRRAAHLHGPYGVGNILRCPTGNVHGLVRQPRLVDQE